MLLAGTPLANDADTLLMLRFDNTAVGVAGETPLASAGVTYESGIVDGAARTANNGYLRYSKTGNLLAAQGTVEFWIMPAWNGTEAGSHNFFEVGDNFNNGMLLAMDGAHNLRCIQWGDDPSTGSVEAGVERGVGASGSSWTAGTWYHIAATWNGASQHLEFFVNGQSVGAINNGVNIANFSTSYFNIGSETNNLTPAISAFDEFRISNRERTAAEISDDYAMGRGIMSSPSGMAADSSGRTFVTESGGNRVSVFSPTGAKQFSIGSFGVGNGQFNNPRDVAVDVANNIYVCDSGNSRVQMFNSTGAYVGQFASNGSAAGQLSAPKGIFVDSNSSKIYVADTGNQRVQRFSANGVLDSTWGSGGGVGSTGTVKRDHSGFDSPTDVAVNPVTGEIYVSDYGNCRIEVFSSSGAYLRTYLAVYHANQIAFDPGGNLYIAGEDPGNGYTAEDGRLRVLKVGQSLITANYTGGALDDIGRIETGVAVRSDGAIVLADSLNGRIAATDNAFHVPASDLKVEAKGTQVTFRWTTRKPVVSVVRYGSTSALGSEQSDSVPTTDHVLTVNGLTPNSRIYYAVGFADSFNGQMRFSPADPINTGVASGSQFLRLKVAGVIYTDSNTGTGYTLRSDVETARSIYSHVAEFYWRNSSLSLWADVTIIEINKDITSGYDLFANMQTDLAAAGYSAADDFDAAWGSSVMCPGNYGGGGSLFGRFVGMCEFASQDDWTLAHEGNHTLDSIYDSMGLRKYEFNHGIWAVPGGVGRDWAINGQILHNMLPANFTAVSGPFTKVMVAPDADGDGVPDSSPAGLTNSLALTELTAGTSPASRDTDNDGFNDLSELTALPYHGTNPLLADTDGDSTADSVDLNPAYRMNDRINRGTPTMDGTIGGGDGWTVLTSNWGYSNNGPSGNGTSDSNAYQSLTTTYAAWDSNYLYLAYKGPANTTNVRIDGSADNWFIGPDNYDLNLNSGSSSYSVRVNVGVPDIYRQIDNDGQYSEFFDTDPQFTKPYQGRTIYNNSGDGLGFSGRLVIESNLTYRRGGTGNNCVWEVAIPWSNSTGLHGQHGKTMALYYNVGGDLLFETDHFAKVQLVDGTPTNITLSSQAIAENQPGGTTVGILSATDSNPTHIFTYTLVNGSGSNDNGFFAIAGNTLKTTDSFDYETKHSYNIRLRVTDEAGIWFEKPFTISITDQLEVLAAGWNDWTAAGLSLILGSDNKLHLYRTGTTVDAVPPHDPTKVVGVSITGRDITDVLIVDYSGVYASLLIDHATLNITQNNAFSASTNVTVNGGVLSFNGHVSAIGNLLLTDDGQANLTAVNNTTTTVTSGTLTSFSIVCDTLTIGLPTGSAAKAVSANTAAASTAEVPQSVESNLPESTANKDSAIASTAIESTSVVKQPTTAKINATTALATSAAFVPLAAEASHIAPSAIPVVSQFISTPEIVSASPLLEQTEQHSELLLVEPLLKKPFPWAINADLNRASRFDILSAHAFSNLSSMTDHLHDSVYGKLTDSLAKAKRQLTPVMAESRGAHSLALHSIVNDYRHGIFAEDSELLIVKHFRKQDELVQKAVDDFHLQLVASD